MVSAGGLQGSSVDLQGRRKVLHRRGLRLVGWWETTGPCLIGPNRPSEPTGVAEEKESSRRDRHRDRDREEDQ